MRNSKSREGYTHENLDIEQQILKKKSFNEIILKYPELINDDNIDQLIPKFKIKISTSYDGVREFHAASFQEMTYYLFEYKADENLLSNLFNKSKLSKEYIITNCDAVIIVNHCDRFSNGELKEYVLNNCDKLCFEINTIIYTLNFTYDEFKIFVSKSVKLDDNFIDSVVSNRKFITDEIVEIVKNRGITLRTNNYKDIFEDTGITVDYALNNLNAFENSKDLMKAILRKRPDIQTITINRVLLSELLE